MKPTLVIGIDPGSSGGIAEIYPDGNCIVCPMMENYTLTRYFADLCDQSAIEKWDLAAFIEQVGGFIGRPQPGSHMFKFGFGAGYIHGLLAANRIPTHLVTPQKWQKGLPGVGSLKGPERKRALRAEAARRFPSVKTTLSTCDALLIADYGKRSLGL